MSPEEWGYELSSVEGHNRGGENGKEIEREGEGSGCWGRRRSYKRLWMLKIKNPYNTKRGTNLIGLEAKLYKHWLGC